MCKPQPRPRSHPIYYPFFSSPLHQSLIEARLAVYPRLLKLSGRLDLMLSHVSTNMNLDEEVRRGATCNEVPGPL